jgi:hypothetical protein
MPVCMPHSCQVWDRERESQFCRIFVVASLPLESAITLDVYTCYTIQFVAHRKNLPIFDSFN